MQLLPKKQVNIEAATLRRQQIDQGLSLAKKVDSVRESLAEEETRLTQFRTETIARVQIEIDAKIRERDTLEDTLVPLRREYRQLLTPPDLTLAREEVMKGKEELLEAYESLREAKQELTLGVALNLKREQENEENRQRTEQELILARKDRREADAFKADSLKELQKARNETQETLLNATIREAAIQLRESGLAEKETYIASELIRLLEVEKQQKDKERQIKDRYDTLIRTENRLKKS